MSSAVCCPKLGSASRSLKRHRLSVVFGSFAGAVGLRHDSRPLDRLSPALS